MNCFKNGIPEIQRILGLKIFQTSDLTIAASEFKVLFLQCNVV